jgi:hypothetical protein
MERISKQSRHSFVGGWISAAAGMALKLGTAMIVVSMALKLLLVGSWPRNCPNGFGSDTGLPCSASFARMV